jgi:hypothetical protein
MLILLDHTLDLVLFLATPCEGPTAVLATFTEHFILEILLMSSIVVDSAVQLQTRCPMGTLGWPLETGRRHSLRQTLSTYRRIHVEYLPRIHDMQRIHCLLQRPHHVDSLTTKFA